MYSLNVPNSPFLIQSFHRSELAGQQKTAGTLLPSHRPARPAPTSPLLCYNPVIKGTVKKLEKSRHLYTAHIHIKAFQSLCYEYKFTVIENNNQTDQHSDCQLVMGGVFAAGYWYKIR